MNTTLEQLRREVKAAWLGACKADGISEDTKFAVFSNTTEAAAYNELMGLYLQAVRVEKKRIAKNAARRGRHAAMTSLGLKRVKGALGGVYYE